MRNFDYLREIEPLQDLRIYCEAAEAECRSKYVILASNLVTKIIVYIFVGETKYNSRWS